MADGGGDGDEKLPSVDHVPLFNEGAVVKSQDRREGNYRFINFEGNLGRV